MTDKKPRKTLIIKRKPVAADTPEPDENSAPLKLTTKKRVIKLDRPTKKPAQPTESPKKKKQIAPSTIRESDLNKALSQQSKAWRAHWPLAQNIEKQVFQVIGANHLSASKRVVKSLLKKHLSAKNYLLNEVVDAARYDLNDNAAGTVTWEQASVAAKLLVKVEAQRAAEKRTKRKK